MTEKVYVQVKMDEGAVLPEYKSEGAAGFDFVGINVQKVFKGAKELPMDKLFTSAKQTGKYILRPGERALVGTGLYFAIPEGYEIQIRDRSGDSLKKGAKILNAPGTIDADYRGEVKLIICNTNATNHLEIHLGQRMAQGILARVPQAEWVEVEELPETVRGEGGFGHTGTEAVGPQVEMRVK